MALNTPALINFGALSETTRPHSRRDQVQLLANLIGTLTEAASAVQRGDLNVEGQAMFGLNAGDDYLFDIELNFTPVVPAAT